MLNYILVIVKYKYFNTNKEPGRNVHVSREAPS